MASKLINFAKYVLCEQPSMARLTVNRAFQKVLPGLKPGRVLEIGAGKNNSNIHYLTRDTHYFSLNLLSSENPDIVADACAMPFRNNSIDSVIMLEVLEHVLNPALLVGECRRIMQKGGTIVCSTRFICPQHGAPHDYYRFTEASIEALFGDFSEYTIEKLGNRLHVLIDIITENYYFLRAFNRLLQYIPVKPSTCYSGLLLFAKK